MTAGRRLLVLLAVGVAVAAGGLLALRAGRAPDAGAERLLGPLPPGYRYAEMEKEDADARTELFRQRVGAADVSTRLVGAPEDLAPIGVAVVAFVLGEAADPRSLARQLEQDVTLVDPQPKVLAGQPVLGHEGDATFSSATLWVHRRLAILTYGATTAEVDGVLEALLAGGAWRDHPAA